MDKKLERILPLVQKPARYTGGEYGEIQKDKSEVDLRMALCFPDTYEIGMSNTGMRILYQVLNDLPGVWCERVFAPWFDMDRQMREKGLPLYALESGDPLSEFDAIGFSLGYEMAYTTVLEMIWPAFRCAAPSAQVSRRSYSRAAAYAATVSRWRTFSIL